MPYCAQVLTQLPHVPRGLVGNDFVFEARVKWRQSESHELARAHPPHEAGYDEEVCNCQHPTLAAASRVSPFLPKTRLYTEVLL